MEGLGTSGAEFAELGRGWREVAGALQAADGLLDRGDLGSQIPGSQTELDVGGDIQVLGV